MLLVPFSLDKFYVGKKNYTLCIYQSTDWFFSWHLVLWLFFPHMKQNRVSSFCFMPDFIFTKLIDLTKLLRDSLHSQTHWQVWFSETGSKCLCSPPRPFQFVSLFSYLLVVWFYTSSKNKLIWKIILIFSLFYFE